MKSIYLLIDSFVETSYLNTEMCKFESSAFAVNQELFIIDVSR